ncbi:MAG TPA: bacillithiol transferase BstA [Verrucomicrobiae bacterium]|nr:bacillithiol transferase BstA [Verrucomicrobiae bacterium]
MDADLRYPIGKPERPERLSAEQRRELIAAIAEAPSKLRAAVAGLSPQQLDTPYRPGGWTVRQVVHHLPDSHMNAYTRFKLALTENQPTIKPYEESAWANLADSNGPIEPSLALFDALHQRWVLLLNSLSAADWEKKFNHPESGPNTLDKALSVYGWHGRHHVAHITALRGRNGW